MRTRSRTPTPRPRRIRPPRTTTSAAGAARMRQAWPMLLLFLMLGLVLPTSAAAGAEAAAASKGVDDDAAYEYDDDALGDDSTVHALAFDGDQHPVPVVEEEADEPNSNNFNIVGGTPTNGQQDAPFFVRGEYGCGAALIAPDLVLGAAHCAAFYGSKVMVGSFRKDGASGGLAVSRAVVSDKHTHPQFQITDRGAQSYDMVLFKIQSVQSYANLKPVVLNPDPTATSPGSVLTMIGFGSTGWNESEPSALLKAHVVALSTTECEQRYGRKPGFLDASATCTLGSNATNSTGSTSCFGDSGGPLVDSSNRLVGILSFGTKYCDPRYPSGSMNVASAMPWIVETACSLTDFQLPYCPLRTVSPTRAPVPTLKPNPPPMPSPTRPNPYSNCVSVDNCASLVKRDCDCPTGAAPKTRCLKRAVKRRCCDSSGSGGRIRTTYFLQTQQAYRTRLCGLT